MNKSENLRKQVWMVDLGGNEKLAMLFFAEKTRSGVAKVKVSDVADVCRVSERQAQKIIKSLLNGGYLHVVGNENGGNSKPRIYKITGSKGEQFSALKGCHKVHPLYICKHKEVYSRKKTPGHGLIAVNDPEINTLLLAGGL